MEKKLELVKEFYDFEEFEDYKASLKSIERRVKKSYVDILEGNLVFIDLNGKIIETRNFDEYQPIQISENREYLLLQKYEEGKIIAQLRNFKEDRIWEKETGRSYYEYVSNDGNCSVIFKGYGSGRNSVVNELEFYNKNGDKMNHVSFEGLIWPNPQVFSNKNQLLIVWTKSIKILEDGSRELSGTACIYTFDFAGNALWNLLIKEQGIHDVKISDDGKTLIVVGEGEGELISDKWQGIGHIYFIDDKGELSNELSFNYGCNNAGIKFSNDMKNVVIFADQNIFFFEGVEGKLLWKYMDPKNYFCFIDISSKSKDIVAGGYDEEEDFYLIIMNKEGKKVAEKKIDISMEPVTVEITGDGEKIFLELIKKGMVFDIV